MLNTPYPLTIKMEPTQENVFYLNKNYNAQPSSNRDILDSSNT